MAWVVQPTQERLTPAWAGSGIASDVHDALEATDPRVGGERLALGKSLNPPTD